MNRRQLVSGLLMVSPWLIGFFALSFPSGLSIYWITSSLAGLVQYGVDGRISFVNRLLKREESADDKKAAKPKKPANAKK